MVMMFCVFNSTEQNNSASDNILHVSPDDFHFILCLRNNFNEGEIKFSISENGSH